MAVDAVAVAAEQGQAVVLKRCEAVAGDNAVCRCGGVAERWRGVSVRCAERKRRGRVGRREVHGYLGKTLERLQLSPAHVVQLKVFLRPASSAEDVLRELKKFFPGQMTPPVVFVEWIAAPDAEIELIAQLPPTDKPAEPVQYYTPPDVRPSIHLQPCGTGPQPTANLHFRPVRALRPAAVRTRCADLFAQLQTILDQTGSDMLHLAKASYFVCDADASRGFDVMRPIAFDPLRPPAASLVMVHGVGKAGRTLTMDMIAVGK